MLALLFVWMFIAGTLQLFGFPHWFTLAAPTIFCLWALFKWPEEF